MLQIVRAIESIRDASGGRIIGWNAALYSQWSGSRDIFDGFVINAYDVA